MAGFTVGIALAIPHVGKVFPESVSDDHGIHDCFATRFNDDEDGDGLFIHLS